MQYNTTREKLIKPEYGRHIQKMVQHAMTLSSKEERTKCAKAIVSFLVQSNNVSPKNIEEAEKKNYEVIIAAAGGAAHLAGVTAALTTIPVLGVPMPSVTNGVDSLYSTVQMPAGVPVATLAIGKAGAKNSALFAIAILSRKYPKIKDKLKKFRSDFESNIPKRPY